MSKQCKENLSQSAINAATAAATAAAAADVAKNVAQEASRVASEVAREAANTAKAFSLFSQSIDQSINYIKADIKEIKDRLDNKYSTKEELAVVARDVSLIQKALYWVVGVAFLAIAGAVFSLILKS